MFSYWELEPIRPWAKGVTDSEKASSAALRASVALTRVRSLCVIMGPLDMKGLVGAATVVGFLMYGAGHVFRGRANFHLHNKMMQDSPSDTEFARMLTNNCVLNAPDFPHQRLRKLWKTMLTIGSRFGGYTWSLWTHGGLGGTMQTKFEPSPIRCGTWIILQTASEWSPCGLVTARSLLGAVVSYMVMLLTTRSSHVT